MSTSSVQICLRRLQALWRQAECWWVRLVLPQILATLPLCLLCWRHCRTLDGKILRLRRISQKLERWQRTIRAYGLDPKAQLEMLDVDHAMRNEMAGTRDMLWGLRADCIDVERMFNQLGYRSHRLQQRQDALMAVLDHCCVAASTVLVVLAEHDAAVLQRLRAQRAA
ncbi:hypothetical protein [Duganella fentianensis]|uniref:hypothetical protein n=1 Tax=Duganella fentianensis TaxID=2692177 RepID=UPI001E37E1E6|nr:hypothetical protein [Duganella fentianensis]